MWESCTDLVTNRKDELFLFNSLFNILTKIFTNIKSKPEHNHQKDDLKMENINLTENKKEIDKTNKINNSFTILEKSYFKKISSEYHLNYSGHNDIFAELISKIPIEIRNLLWIGNGQFKNYNMLELSDIIVNKHDNYQEITANVKDDISTLYENYLITNKTPRRFKGIYDIYTNYKGLTSSQKYKYLSWLGNMTSDIEFQYPFIFYQGMERHMVNGNLDIAFYWFDRLIRKYDFDELEGYLFSDALYAYAKFGENKYMKQYILPESLSKDEIIIYRVIVGQPFESSDLDSSIWNIGLNENDKKFYLLSTYSQLRKYYMNKAIIYLYGKPYFKVPSLTNLDIIINNGFDYSKKTSKFIKNRKQYFFANTSNDLEKERIMWVQSVYENSDFKKAILEIINLTSEFIEKEFERRENKGLKIRNAKLKNMYDPLV